MIILRLLLLLTNLHLKLLSTQGTGADKLLSTQRVMEHSCTTSTTSNIGVSIISLHDTPRLHTLKRVRINLMRLAHI